MPPLRLWSAGHGGRLAQPKEADVVNRNGKKTVIQMVGGFGTAEYKVAIRLNDVAQLVENPLFGRNVEIDEDVANEDKVQGRQFRRASAQIDVMKLDPSTQVIANLPAVFHLLKVGFPQLDGQASGDFQVAVDAGRSALEHCMGQVAGKKADVPPGQGGKVLIQEHGHAVGFLPAGAGSTPDVETANVRVAAQAPEEWIAAMPRTRSRRGRRRSR